MKLKFALACNKIQSPVFYFQYLPLGNTNVGYFSSQALSHFLPPPGHRSLFSAWHLSSWFNRVACFSRSQNTDLYAKAKHFTHSFRGHLLSLSYSFPFHDLSEAHKHMGQCLSFRIFQLSNRFCVFPGALLCEKLQNLPFPNPPLGYKHYFEPMTEKKQTQEKLPDALLVCIKA